MARPLMQHGVRQLEELFSKSKSDSKVLKQLEHELQYRQVPRAVALLAEVQAGIHLLSPALAFTPAVKSPPPPPAPAPQPSLWDNPAPAARPAEPPPPAVAAPVLPRQAMTAADARPANPPSPPMPLDDAYKLLQATPSSTWESIEQARRIFVQASHPSKVRTLAEARCSQVLAEAKRVNEAYAALSQARCAGR
jgi:hypothetical protein